MTTWYDYAESFADDYEEMIALEKVLAEEEGK